MDSNQNRTKGKGADLFPQAMGSIKKTPNGNLNTLCHICVLDRLILFITPKPRVPAPGSRAFCPSTEGHGSLLPSAFLDPKPPQIRRPAWLYPVSAWMECDLPRVWVYAKQGTSRQDENLLQLHRPQVECRR